MSSSNLARDYVRRARVRLKTLDLLFDEESWADVVRESQETVELAFYGAEDLTPSGFYAREDAEEARALARTTVELVLPHVPH